MNYRIPDGQFTVDPAGPMPTITFSATCGAFELNTMLPVVAYNMLLSIELLANASRVFAKRCVAGLEADAEKCRGNIEQSLAMATALAPAIGRPWSDPALRLGCIPSYGMHRGGHGACGSD